MSIHEESTSKFETIFREEQLKKQFYIYAWDLWVAKHIEHRLLGFTPKSNLTKDKFAHLVAHINLSKFPKKHTNHFEFEVDVEMSINNSQQNSNNNNDYDSSLKTGSNKFGDDYLKITRFDLVAARDKSLDSNKVVKPKLVNKTKHILSRTTFELWNQISRKT